MNVKCAFFRNLMLRYSATVICVVYARESLKISVSHLFARISFLRNHKVINKKRIDDGLLAREMEHVASAINSKPTFVLFRCCAS